MTETPGKIHESPGNMRLTTQPGIKNGYVWRKSGVNRKSERVIERNNVFTQKMMGKHAASECKGKPRAQFFSCLRTAGKRAWGSA